jgi:hypothetical protein
MRTLASIIISSIGMTTVVIPIKVICLAVCIILIITEVKTKRDEI